MSHPETCRARIYDQFLSTENGKLRMLCMGQGQLEAMIECQAQVEKLRKIESDAQAQGGRSSRGR